MGKRKTRRKRVRRRTRGGNYEGLLLLREDNEKGVIHFPLTDRFLSYN